jgi:hypothetical protein
MVMSGWGCAYEIDGMCSKVRGFACDPAMKGCVLYGKVQKKNSNADHTHPDSENQNPAADQKPALSAADIRAMYSKTK